MKRSFLSDLGIEKDHINLIMAEIGETRTADMAVEKEKLNDLQEQLNQAKQTIDELTEDNEYLTSSDDYQALKAENERLKGLIDLDHALLKEGVKGRYLGAVKSLLPDGLNMNDFKDVMKDMKQNYKELF